MPLLKQDNFRKGVREEQGSRPEIEGILSTKGPMGMVQQTWVAKSASQSQHIYDPSVILVKIWPEIMLIGTWMGHFFLEKLVYVWVHFQIPSCTSLPIPPGPPFLGPDLWNACLVLHPRSQTSPKGYDIKQPIIFSTCILCTLHVFLDLFCIIFGQFQGTFLVSYFAVFQRLHSVC